MLPPCKHPCQRRPPTSSAFQPQPDLSTQLKRSLALASSHGSNGDPTATMGSFAQKRGAFLSLLILPRGLTGWLPSLHSAFSALKVALLLTVRARLVCGKPIAPFTVVPTGVTLALPI